MALPELPVTRLTGPLTVEQTHIIASQLQLPREVNELFVGGDIVVTQGAKEPYSGLQVRSAEKDAKWKEIAVANSRGGLTESTKGVTEVYDVCQPFADDCDGVSEVSTYRPGTKELADKFVAVFSCVDPLFTTDMNAIRVKFGLSPCEFQPKQKPVEKK